MKHGETIIMRGDRLLNLHRFQKVFETSVVFWKNRITGSEGHGSLVSLSNAQASKKMCNAKYTNMQHEVVTLNLVQAEVCRVEPVKLREFSPFVRK